MTLTLRIQNYDVLQDGGPTFITVDKRGLHAGRSSSMDWVLPDPQRMISSHHFDIDYANGGYWMTDKSTNGVFLDGQRHRLEGAYQLKNGDRFQVGHYFVVVSLDGGGQAAAAPPAAAQPAPSYSDAADPWSVDAPPSAPINPMPTPEPRRFEDFSGEFIGNPSPVAPAAAPSPFGAAPAASPFGADPVAAAASPFGAAPAASGSPFGAAAPAAASGSPFGGAAPAASGSPFGAPPAAPSPFGAAPPPAAAPVAFGSSDGAFSPTPAPAPVAAPIAAPAAPPLAAAAPPAAATPTSAGNAQAIVRAFCEGAGLNPDAHLNMNAETLARELGKTMRVAASEMMNLLHDRATTKKFTKGGDRTMLGASDNNPLKFLPDSTQALEVMFMKPRDGFLKGGEGMAAAFADVRRHQTAVFAAIQPALIKLLSDLSPEAIEEEAGGGIMGGGKRKAWETFVERWDAKTAKYENGMLDVFLAHFAEAYAAAVDQNAKPK